MTLRNTFLCLFVLSFAPCLSASGAAGGDSADIVIYGATPSGVMAAVQAARLGKSVVLVEPGRHAGGMAASGLGMTDIGRKAAIGGLAREYYQRAYAWYNSPDAWKHETRADYLPKHRDAFDHPMKTQFFMEPHVAEKLFNQFLNENRVPVVFGERLDRAGAGAAKDGARIVSIRMESGRVFAGKMFIDATYEGDLLAAAGAAFMLGREDNARFGETLNGIRYLPAEKVSPFVNPGAVGGDLLPFIDPAPPGPEGAGDHRVQAYNFRFCLTDVPENSVPVAKPENYNPALYELLAREFQYQPNHFPGKSLFKLSPMPNRKTDSNNHSRFSTDFVGNSHEWAGAGHARRAEIWREHRDYTLGFLWFLGHDPRVPQKVRAEVLRWGLPRDEFQDGGHWPWQLYIREARRLLGEYVITEHDCTGGVAADDPVGMGSYHMDSHQVSRYVDAGGRLHVEGGFFQSVDPFGISYRAPTPRAAECANLLVPVCVSATHVACGSVRMEPVFMILGQSAATAAALAIDAGVAVQSVDYKKLRARLLHDKQVLDYAMPAKFRAPTGDGDVGKAVGILVSKNIINAADKSYWLARTAGPALCDGEKVAALLIKAAGQKQSAKNVHAAVGVLLENNIIKRGDYWRAQAEENKFCNGRYVAELLVMLSRL
ncbi:MAG: FAD-dependent oxidoreductase [Opitutaceae bacterium]|jgi:hypothetical protein|nr:FAD-dependent oxidoreductase [Opitutaceae bacterium]